MCPSDLKINDVLQLNLILTILLGLSEPNPIEFSSIIGNAGAYFCFYGLTLAGLATSGACELAIMESDDTEPSGLAVIENGSITMVCFALLP